MAAHGRLPGLVTLERPRAVKEPCRGHQRGGPSPSLPRRTRRPVYPHVYGVDAGVSDTARRKPARSSAPAIASCPGIRSARPHGRWPCQPCLPACRRPGMSMARLLSHGHGPGKDVPASEPSPAQARTGYGCPIPRDEPAEPLSEPCAPIAKATGCPACIPQPVAQRARGPTRPIAGRARNARSCRRQSRAPGAWCETAPGPYALCNHQLWAEG